MKSNSTVTPPITVEDTLNSLHYWHYDVAHWLLLIYPPIFLVFGNIGNVLSLLVMLRPRMRSTSLGVYLALLAMSDIIYVNTNLIVRTIEAISEDTYSIRCWLGCKLYSYN